jgi:hypothetical protein
VSDESAVSANASKRTDDRELTLVEATSRIKAIEDMMHPLLLLANQIVALMMAIQAQTE